MRKFDEIADSCLKKAESHARVKDKDKKVRVSHVIYAILSDKKYNIVIGVLEELNIDVDLLTDSVEIVRIENIIEQESKLKEIPHSKKLKEILDFTLDNILVFEGKEDASIIDIFLSCLQIENELTEVFNDLHLDYEKFKEMAIEIESIDYEDDYEGDFELAGYVTKNNKNVVSKTQNLDKYCINITNLALENKIDLCFGREKEMNELYRILSRSKKKNAILLGREGVGKTNLVEGLAVNIIRGNSPSGLQSKIIYSLDINTLVAGTKYRGMFEERIQAVLDELLINENAILFIDEIHTIIGAGASEGSGDLSNILKPYLARKGFQIIGATTTNEYKKYIEKDKALVRRFSEIIIEEPSIEDAIKILNSIKNSFEEVHNVKFTDEAIKACVELSSKYIPYRTLPDKAIDILDDAAAKKKISNIGISRILKLQEEYEQIEEQKREIIRNKAYHLAEEVKKKSSKILSKIKSERGVKNKNSEEIKIISEDDIKEIIQEVTKIPITEKGLDVIGLKSHLQNKIIGQEEAVNSLIKTVLLNKLELDDSEKPIGSFLFIGYSGVGKTQLTKELSNFLSGDDNHLIRFDCSEYSQPHEVSKLIGAPAGYVGYDEGGILTEKVKRNPFAVILFDEIEKGHEKLFDILLQILGEGRLTDNKGETINFKNTFIIMTSNVGTKKAFQNKSSIGYSKNTNEYEHSIVETEVKKQFKPEFINRVDNIIHFNVLSKESIKTLLGYEIDKLKKQVLKHGVKLYISEEVINHLLDENYSIEYGFRPFKRKINDNIKLMVAEILLNETPKEIKVIISEGKIKAVV